MSAVAQLVPTYTLDEALDLALVNDSLEPRQAAILVIERYGTDQVLEWARAEVEQLFTERASILRRDLREEIRGGSNESKKKARKILGRVSTCPRSVIGHADPLWSQPTPFNPYLCIAEMTRDDVEAVIARVEHGMKNYEELLREFTAIRALLDEYSADAVPVLIAKGVPFPS